MWPYFAQSCWEIRIRITWHPWMHLKRGYTHTSTERPQFASDQSSEQVGIWRGDEGKRVGGRIMYSSAATPKRFPTNWNVILPIPVHIYSPTVLYGKIKWCRRINFRNSKSSLTSSPIKASEMGEITSYPFVLRSLAKHLLLKGMIYRTRCRSIRARKLENMKNFRTESLNVCLRNW